MADVTFKKGTKAEIDAEPISDGRILFTTDQTYNKIYADNGTNRIQIGGTIDVDTTLSTTSSNPIANSAVTTEFDKINTYLSGLIDLMRPVRSFLITEDPTDPSTIYKGTTWKLLKDVVIVGAGGLYPVNSTGGSRDAIVVSHSHSVSISGGNHVHAFQIFDNSGYGTEGVSANRGASGTLSHASQTEGIPSGAITMSGSTSTDGASGAGANMMPYTAKYIWQRIS